MLALNVTYHCKPGKREEFYKAICDLGVGPTQTLKRVISNTTIILTFRTPTFCCW